MPKVSVIMPAYNREHYIGLAIESILQQTFRDFELIIVDDCSTDRTAQIAHSFAQLDPKRIKVITHNSNRGVASARNTGIQHSRSEILMMADTDDIQHPDRLQITYEEMIRTQADIIFNDCKMIDINGYDLKRTKGYPPELNSDNMILYLLERNYFWTSLTMLRKNKDVYFDEKLLSSEDYDLFLRLAIKGYRFVICDSILTSYRLHDSNLSADGKVSQAATRYIFSKLDIAALHLQLIEEHGSLVADEAIASVYSWLNQPEHVIECIGDREALSFNALFMLGVSFYKTGDLSSSLHTFLKLTHASNSSLNPALLNNIAVLEILLHQNEEQAELLLHQALSSRTDYQDASFNLNIMQQDRQGKREFKLTERPLRTEVIHTEHYKLM